MLAGSSAGCLGEGGKGLVVTSLPLFSTRASLFIPTNHLSMEGLGVNMQTALAQGQPGQTGGELVGLYLGLVSLFLL